MKIIQTQDFEKSLKKLPQKIKKLFAGQAKRFSANWYDPRLHTKKLKGLEQVFSFRITRRYRVLFYFQNTDTAIFFDFEIV